MKRNIKTSKNLETLEPVTRTQLNVNETIKGKSRDRKFFAVFVICKNTRNFLSLFYAFYHLKILNKYCCLEAK